MFRKSLDLHPKNIFHSSISFKVSLRPMFSHTLPLRSRFIQPRTVQTGKAAERLVVAFCGILNNTARLPKGP